jgi:hypothetical protein
LSAAAPGPRQEAQARLDALEPGVYEARVLEPSPPPVTAGPWFADDPVAPAPRSARRLVSPVPNADLTWDELARDTPTLRRWCADRWLGGWSPLQPVADAEAFAATRGSWHRLAEHVLAPARHRATGKIGLRFTRHGFGTPFLDGPDRQVRVEDRALVVVGAQDRRVPADTLRAAGDAIGLDPRAGTGVYEPTTAAEPDAPLAIDDESASRLGDWFGFAASVLEELRAAAPDGGATRVQLWPEHFDLSVDLGDEATGQRGTYGASPGDGAHPLPYLYVTHWAPVPEDPFWDEAEFAGASLGYAALLAAADQRDAALSFLRRGMAVLAGR